MRVCPPAPARARARPRALARVPGGGNPDKSIRIYVDKKIRLSGCVSVDANGMPVRGNLAVFRKLKIVRNQLEFLLTRADTLLDLFLLTLIRVDASSTN